jgi:hypothetical protein
MLLSNLSAKQIMIHASGKGGTGGSFDLKNAEQLGLLVDNCLSLRVSSSVAAGLSFTVIRAGR